MANDFNPDVYLSEKSGSSGFDPDAYLKSKIGGAVKQEKYKDEGPMNPAALAARGVFQTLTTGSPEAASIIEKEIGGGHQEQEQARRLMQGQVDFVTKNVPEAVQKVQQKVLPYVGAPLTWGTKLTTALYPESPGGAGATILGGKALEMASPYLSKLPLLKSAEERIGSASANVLTKARELGIPMSVTDITRSPTWARIEELVRNTPFGAKGMELFRQKQQDMAFNALKKMADKTGASKDVMTLGNELLDAVSSNAAKKEETAEALYDRAMSQVHPRAPVAIPRTIARANEILSEQRRLLPTSQNKEWISVAEDIIKNPTMEFEGLRGNRSSWLSKIRAADEAKRRGMSFLSDPKASMYKRLIGPLQQDFEDFSSKQPEAIGDSLKLANSYYKGFKGRFDNDVIRKIARQNPEKLVGTILRPRNATEIFAMRKAVGEKAFNGIKREFYDQLLSAGRQGEFSPQAARTIFSKFEASDLKAMLKPKEIQDLKNFFEVTSEMDTANKVAGNPSGTGRTLISFVNGMLTMHNPVTGTAITISQPVAAKILTSDRFRALMMDGLKTGTMNPKSAKLWGELAAVITSNQAVAK